MNLQKLVDEEADGDIVGRVGEEPAPSADTSRGWVPAVLYTALFVAGAAWVGNAELCCCLNVILTLFLKINIIGAVYCTTNHTYIYTLCTKWAYLLRPVFEVRKLCC